MLFHPLPTRRSKFPMVPLNKGFKISSFGDPYISTDPKPKALTLRIHKLVPIIFERWLAGEETHLKGPEYAMLLQPCTTPKTV